MQARGSGRRLNQLVLITFNFLYKKKKTDKDMEEDMEHSVENHLKLAVKEPDRLQLTVVSLTEEKRKREIT